MTSVTDRIEALVKEHPVVLFMKGSRSAPQCGFSARTVAALDDFLPDYTTVNVLADQDIRDGIKAFSSWPTIPQLYVNGEFVGGCDIITEMPETELSNLLGVPVMEVSVPEVHISERAMKAFADYAESDSFTIRFSIEAGFEYILDFGEATDKDVVAQANTGKCKIVMNKKTARMAGGTEIDFVDGPQGAGFKITNPNEPPKVRPLSVTDLKSWLEGNKALELFDVRSEQERSGGTIPSSVLLDDAGKERLKQLDLDTTVVFFCHHGMRSQAAAQHAIRMGFQDVFNVVGGIDRWSIEVDPNIARY